MSPDVVDLLLAWRKVQLTERMRAGTSWEGTAAGYVFTTETGRLLDQRNASRAYARALKRAGLGTVPARFHIIRHSVASMMLVDGAVSVRTASEVLGHATTSITADIYGHVAEQAKTHALEVVAGALRTTASGTAGHRCGACGTAPNCHQNCHPARQRPCHHHGDRASDLRVCSPGWTRTNNPSG